MSVAQVQSHTVPPEPLAPEPFARFDDVAAPPIGERRRYLPTALDRAKEANTMSLWISSVAATATLCEADSVGRPDLNTLWAFLAGSHQVVTYARNVWHHAMTVLDNPMEFAVAWPRPDAKMTTCGKPSTPA